MDRSIRSSRPECFRGGHPVQHKFERDRRDRKWWAFAAFVFLFFGLALGASV